MTSIPHDHEANYRQRTRERRASARKPELNWRLVVALAVNAVLWAGLIFGITRSV